MTSRLVRTVGFPRMSGSHAGAYSLSPESSLPSCCFRYPHSPWGGSQVRAGVRKEVGQGSAQARQQPLRHRPRCRGRSPACLPWLRIAGWLSRQLGR